MISVRAVEYSARLFTVSRVLGSEMLARLLHPVKALPLIVVMPSGMVMVVNPRASANALLPMVVTLPSVGILESLVPWINVLVPVSMMQLPWLW